MVVKDEAHCSKPFILILALCIFFSQVGFVLPSPEKQFTDETDNTSPEINPSGETLHAVPIGEPYSTEGISPKFSLKHYVLEDGQLISAAIINGPPNPSEEFAKERQASITPFTTRGALSEFPSFKWVFGCSAVAGAMIAAYYDRNAFPNMYTGPTGSGFYPITDTSWPIWQDSASRWYPNNPLVASQNGVDGRLIRGSINNYWVSLGSNMQDPYILNGWTQHAWGDAIGDYMKTSQSQYGNHDGETTFWYLSSGAGKLTCQDMEQMGVFTSDGNYGRKLFYEARGYIVSDCFTQFTDNQVSGGFSLQDYKNEINSGHPVMIHLEGHTVVGYGYTGNYVLIRDTWDNDPDTHYSMLWGDSYDGMKMFSVSIARPRAQNLPPIDIFLSRDWVAEQKPSGSLVGILFTQDTYLGESHTYSLVAGVGSEDNSSFHIQGNKLITNEVFDIAVKDQYLIRVRSEDQGNLSIEKNFTILIKPAFISGEVYLPIIFYSQ